MNYNPKRAFLNNDWTQTSFRWESVWNLKAPYRLIIFSLIQADWTIKIWSDFDQDEDDDYSRILRWVGVGTWTGWISLLSFTNETFWARWNFPRDISRIIPINVWNYPNWETNMAKMITQHNDKSPSLSSEVFKAVASFHSKAVAEDYLEWMFLMGWK